MIRETYKSSSAEAPKPRKSSLVGSHLPLPRIRTGVQADRRGFADRADSFELGASRPKFDVT